MIEMQHNRNADPFCRGPHHRSGECQASVADGPLANLQDHRGLFLLSGVHNALHLLHIVGIKGANSKVTFESCRKQLLTGDEWHL